MISSDNPTCPICEANLALPFHLLGERDVLALHLSIHEDEACSELLLHVDSVLSFESTPLTADHVAMRGLRRAGDALLLVRKLREEHGV